ncbi:tryptophan-rich sensory protein [Propioniciclava flava]|uniref:Tryptophan-rich sensory protein n=1 Tax=Propioniciclava flava TaxID=2072026 RepID=A0A4Q2EHN4_9ACTN|nr:tryptophan-rich sensory protein [Propioniciclava flava]RXW32583.1 hypothetical protein C1706_05315 [Propioniciclava flava]
MSATVRRVLVTISAVFMVLGTLYGFGVIGQRVEQSSGGAFAADATLVTPASPAFSIWSVIYLGLFAYVAWQWLPAARHSGRADRIWWLAAVSMLLNGAWLLVTQVGWVWVSVVVIAALALTLGEVMARLSESPARTATEGVLLDGVFGLYLGWVSVATIANVTAALVASGVNPPLEQGQVWAIGILAVGALLGVVFALRLGGRISVAAAMAWAMVWIAVGRLTAAPASTVVGVVAVAAAAVILVAAVAVRGRRARIPAAGR